MKQFIPTQAWTRRLDQVLNKPGKPGIPLNAWQIIKMLPLVVRLIKNVNMFKKAGINSMPVLGYDKPGAVHGVPLGGIGGGSIGRGWRGDFRRWTIRPGSVHHQPVYADQFSLYVQREGEKPEATTLSPVKPVDKQLNSWNWGLDPSCATYHGLFPRAWTTYENPLPGVRLTCKQVSPVIPHNYKETSFPVAVFEWSVENTGNKTANIGLMFTFQNGTGTANDWAGGHYNRAFTHEIKAGEKFMGVELHHTHRQIKSLVLGEKQDTLRDVIEDPLTFAIATRQSKGVQVTYHTQFQANGTGDDVWQSFSQKGELENKRQSASSGLGEAIGAGIAVKARVQPGKTATFSFSLAWDMPVVHTGQGTPFKRRYTVFYGSKGNAASRMATDGLVNYYQWERKIEAWQQPILDDKKLPDWYKSALFNELYYVVEGGVLWGYSPHQKLGEKEMGHYWYLEGHEYRMVNTYDVHFYSSIALAMLWPRIELSITRDFAKATLEEDPTPYQMVFESRFAPRKVRGAVPHDLGWPEEDPYRIVNGYNMHDTGRWKDLNPKFVLQVYRDYVFTGDRAFARECFPAVKAAVDYLHQFDRDGDGLIENDPYPPDQTYDTWSVDGPSAYTGGLWLACLSAAVELAKIANDKDSASRYRSEYTKGHKAYLDILWNGKYLDYDRSTNNQHDSVMSDQLAGHWFAHMCGLPPIVDVAKARSALKTILEKNVMGVRNGTLGAMNGVRPDGRIDKTTIQSQEVWAGTTYALAATMIHEGMIEEAFQTAKGIYQTAYERMGYWYATPEAWYLNGNYRSLTYMRPLAIWAMQYAWQKRKKKSK